MAEKPTSSAPDNGPNTGPETTPESTSESTPSRLPFAQLQRWFMQRVVALGDGPEVAARFPAPDIAAERIIKPSATLDVDARLAIYHRMYRIRVRKLLAGEHPVIEGVLGTETFEQLAFDYFTRFPPSDFTLRNLAHALPYYLQHVYKGEDAVLLRDIAQLEHAMSDAFDTEEMGKITAASLGEVPPELWPELRFRMDPSFRLLALEHDASAFLDAHKAERPYPERMPRKHWVVVWRHENKVWRQAIKQTVYEMLLALSSGETVTTALERGMNVWTGSEEALEKNVFQWFADWMNEGYFRSIVKPS